MKDYLWLLFMTLAYLSAARLLSWAHLSASNFKFLIIVVAGLMTQTLFALAYRYAPAYRTAWFVGIGISVLVGIVSARVFAREWFKPLEFLGVVLILTGSVVLMLKSGR